LRKTRTTELQGSAKDNWRTSSSQVVGTPHEDMVLPFKRHTYGARGEQKEYRRIMGYAEESD